MLTPQPGLDAEMIIRGIEAAFRPQKLGIQDVFVQRGNFCVVLRTTVRPPSPVLSHPTDSRRPPNSSCAHPKTCSRAPHRRRRRKSTPASFFTGACARATTSSRACCASWSPSRSPRSPRPCMRRGRGLRARIFCCGGTASWAGWRRAGLLRALGCVSFRLCF